MTIEAIATRINELISLADRVLTTTKTPNSSGSRLIIGSPPYVEGELFQEFRSASLSFLRNSFGAEHVFFKEFEEKVARSNPSETTRGRGILKAAKQEIDGGWVFTVKGIVSAEIFTDFLEMASHLLQEGYKDPAAVMIGSVLEEHLRQLCTKNGVDTTVPDAKTGRDVPKKADRLNNDLTAAGVYNKLYQKTILGWLDLRNQAAHGHYTEYDIKQVQLMEDGVTDFMAKTSG